MQYGHLCGMRVVYLSRELIAGQVAEPNVGRIEMSSQIPEIETKPITPLAAAVEAPTKVRVWLAALLSFTLLVAYLDRVNVSVLIASPRFLEDMGLKNNPVGQGLLMSFFLVAYGLGNVLLGPVGDRLGPRKAMTIALIGWTIPCCIGAVARSVSVLYASRFLLGAGEAMHYPMQSSYVKNWFPLQERAKANSSWIFGQMIGPGIAMPLFAAIVGAYGWRATFWLCAILGVVVTPCIWYFTTDRPEQHRGVNKAELEHILKGQVLDKTTREGDSGELAFEELHHSDKESRLCLLHVIVLGFGEHVVGNDVVATAVSESGPRFLLGKNGILRFPAVLCWPPRFNQRRHNCRPAEESRPHELHRTCGMRNVYRPGGSCSQQ
jgi:MFS family permease